MSAKPRPGNGDPHHAKAARAAVAHAQKMADKAAAETKAHKTSAPQARDKAGKFRR